MKLLREILYNNYNETLNKVIPPGGESPLPTIEPSAGAYTAPLVSARRRVARLYCEAILVA